jgi:hypothetical protein
MICSRLKRIDTLTTENDCNNYYQTDNPLESLKCKWENNVCIKGNSPTNPNQPTCGLLTSLVCNILGKKMLLLLYTRTLLINKIHLFKNILLYYNIFILIIFNYKTIQKTSQSKNIYSTFFIFICP